MSDDQEQHSDDGEQGEESQSGSEGGSEQGEEFDRERAQALIDKLRPFERDAKRLTRELTAAQAKLKEIEDAQLSEQERQTRRVAELESERSAWEAERQESRLRLAVYSQAQALEIADADLVLAALDRSGLEYDGDGKPTNLAAIVGELLERKPLLWAKSDTSTGTPGDTNAGGGGKTGRAPNLTAEQLAAAVQLGMTPERYATFAGVTSVDDYQQLRAKETQTAK